MRDTRACKAVAEFDGNVEVHNRQYTTYEIRNILHTCCGLLSLNTTSAIRTRITETQLCEFAHVFIMHWASVDGSDRERLPRPRFHFRLCG